MKTVLMAPTSTRSTWQRSRSNVCPFYLLQWCSWKHGIDEIDSLSKACVCADKQVFSKLDTVGWYSTGQSIGLHDMQIHKLVGAFIKSCDML